MDRFVSALASHYSCGIFITTGGFTKTAPQEAAQNPHVTTVDGDQVAELILAKAVCVLDSGEAVDENYFSQIEARADGSERRRS
jgi:restriction endonuclease Mrr